MTYPSLACIRDGLGDLTPPDNGGIFFSMKNENGYQSMADGCLIEDLLEALVRAGHSNTRARRAVLRALCEADGQATPAQLLALGRVHLPSLGLVTVYRTLEILSELGLVRKLHLDEGCSTYALSPAAVQYTADAVASPAVPDHVHSHHVICRHCRRAVEFAGCDLQMLVDAVETQTGYRVTGHWLEMFGLCPDCQATPAAVGEV